MKNKLLEIIACPRCKGTLLYDKKQEILTCETEGLVFPIKDGIPVLLEDQAQVTNN